MARMPLLFGGGLWQATDPRAVPDGMAQTSDNVAVDRDPQGRAVGARVRKGYSLFAEGGPSKGIMGGGVEFPKERGTATELLWYHTGALRKGLTGTAIPIDPASATPTCAVSGAVTFVMLRDPSDETDKAYFMADAGLWVYDAGFLMNTKGTAGTYSPNLAALPPEEPNRLAATTDTIHLAREMGVAWDSIALGYQDRLYLSHPLQPNYFPLNSYWDIVSDRGDWITAIYGASRGAVIVGKSRSVWVLRGTDFESAERVMVSRNIGIPAAATIMGAEELGGVIFQGSDGQVYLMDAQGGLPVMVSEPIYDMLAELDPLDLRFAHAWILDQRYWLRATSPTAIPERTYVFDMRSRRWTYYPTFPRGLASFTYEGNVLMGGVDNAELFLVDDGTTDNGAAITGTYRTGLVAPAGPSNKHLYRELYLTVKGSGSLGVTVTVDGTTRNRSLSLSAAFKEFRIPINAAGKWLDVELTGTDWHVLSPAAVDYMVLDAGRGQ